jgi:hypothetical protein
MCYYYGMFPVVVSMARYQNGKETVLEGYGSGINLSPILNFDPVQTGIAPV